MFPLQSDKELGCVFVFSLSQLTHVYNNWITHKSSHHTYWCLIGQSTEIDEDERKLH